jgi:type IV pilus assembly protein PilW
MKNKNAFLHQKGFSLVELMVGLIIGLLATLVIMQVFSTFEGQKRSTSGSADAQTNGSIALMSIQRNVQMAGYGLPLPMADVNENALRCSIFADFTNPDTGNTTNIFPLEIEDGGNGSDNITVRYSTNAMGALPMEIINENNATTTGLVVESTMGCNIDGNDANDDIALIQNGTSCDMTTIDNISGTAGGGVQRIILSALPTNAAVVAHEAAVTCMGNWQDYTFDVNNNDELQLNGSPIVSEVVNIQAQYGVSNAAGQNNVTNWVDAAAGTIWETPSVANRNRIKAIRVVVVLRNGLLEKTNVTAAALVAWTPLNGSTAPAIDLSGDANWQRYRYRTFETIIPLRNIIWSREAVL